MRKAFFVFVAAVIATGALMADTVIWYRFDDQEPLTSTAAGVYVTNCVAATYPAHPRTIYENQYNDDNETNPKAGYLPAYTNSAPAGYCVYDPVTGMRVENRCGLHFHTTGSSDKNGGMLRVTEDAALNALTNLTLEAFVRLPTDVPITASYMRPIILKANQGFQGTWGLHVFESNIFHRATILRSDGTQGVCTWGNGQKSSPRVDDGRWHHLAVTYDFGKKKVIAYVDYAAVNTQTLSDTAIGFYHPSNSPLQIGGNASHTTRRHNGEIDEVRISDEALPPEKFLRYIPLREIDADTMFYLPFDTGAEDWFSKTAPPLNAATNAPGGITVERYAGPDPASFTNDVPGIGIRNGIYASEGHANGGAVHLPVTGVGSHIGTSFLLKDPNRLVTASNFTFEAFVKTDRQTTRPSDNQFADSFAIFHTGYMKLLINGGNNQTLFRYTGSNGMQDQGVSKRLDDGNWHHVAFVHDAAEERVTGYIDYKQVTTKIVGTSGSAENIRISGESSSYQTIPGCLDEVRITRRALSVTEFLTTHDCVTGPTLAHADFEEDMDLSPDTGLIASGVVSSRTGGSVPDLADSVPGRIALDGAAMQDVRENKKSVRIDGGRAAWTESIFLNKSSFTVEFFAKLDGLDYCANLLRLTQGSSPDGTPVWALFTFADGAANSLTICAQDASELRYFANYDFAASIADGRWHHWAITFDGTSGTDTVITLYRDYTSLGSRTLSTPICYRDNVNTLCIGGTTVNPAHIHGNFDELRVSEGVLPTSAFLRAQPNSTMLIVR